MRHLPVLLTEVLDSLQPKPNQNFIDGTVGDAGHAEKILAATAPRGRLLAIDADPESLLRAKQFLYEFGERVMFVRDNFENLAEIVAVTSLKKIDGILLDLGWSSPQFEERGRGFSFLNDEPLDMRYTGGQMSDVGDQRSDIGDQTATELVNTLTAAELEKLFREYGEENLSREIAEAIVVARTTRLIERTGQLVEIILHTYRTKLKTEKEIPWIGGLHPATKVFQALRIAVNHELESVEKVLPAAVEILAPGGRLAVITFHSLEDRIVKHFFKSQVGKTLQLITKKPLIAGPEEYAANPRARSAKLRVIEKI